MDAQHIAIATVARVDGLVRWNLEHIVNPFRRRSTVLGWQGSRIVSAAANDARWSWYGLPVMFAARRSGAPQLPRPAASSPGKPAVNLPEEVASKLGRAQARRLGEQARCWARRWRVPALLREVEIRWNPRLRVAVARYRRDLDVIELGPRFLLLRTRSAEVLAHELAHATAARLFGRSEPVHGPRWKDLVRAAGFAPQVRLNIGARTTTKPPRSGAHYEHRCPVCQMRRVARRPVGAWRCAACVAAGLPGRLVVTKIEARP